MNIFSKLLCRILPVQWQQPILTSNTSNPNFQVWRWLEGGGSLENYDAWGAFSGAGTTTNAFHEERWCALNIGMSSTVPLTVTGYQFHQSNGWGSEWGAAKRSQLYGSNDGGATWAYISGCEGPGNGWLTNNFSNSTPYNHFRLRIESGGGGHTDKLMISHVSLTATYEDFV